jgi:DNA-binding protein HU-beta
MGDAVLTLFDWRTAAALKPRRRAVLEILRKKTRRRNMANQRMTQTQLVRSLAESCEVNNKTARAFLDGLSSLAIAEVKKNGVFVLPGIGRLVRVDRKARIGRNPATGESIKIPAKKVVKFRVAKAAKDTIVPPKKK